MIAVTVSIFLSIGLAANFLLQRQFDRYLLQEQGRQNKALVNQVVRAYGEDSGWNLALLDKIGMEALENGMIIKVYEAASDEAVWDATQHNRGMCAAMLTEMAEKMQKYQGSQGAYEETLYALTSEGKSIGQLVIGFYGPFFYTDNDVKFLQTLNRLLLGGFVLATMASALFAIYLGGKIAQPLSNVVEQTRRIAAGNYQEKITSPTYIKDLQELSAAVRTLGVDLARQESIRQRMSADVAHELRTPLTTLQSHLEAMIDGVWPTDTNRLVGCRDEVLRLGKLVSDLEVLARAEASEMTYQRASVDLAQVVEKVCSAFADNASHKGIKLTCTPMCQQILGDEGRLYQAVSNLVLNAVKYTDSGGKIRVWLETQGDQAIIAVEDTGIGIEPEDLPLIFLRFYRADASRSRETGGAGIGLSIALAIARAHGGDIRVESRLGQGSCFRLLLPLNADAS
jgi:signal transduction histidine kinase